jgi:hypothetical protein
MHTVFVQFVDDDPDFRFLQKVVGDGHLSQGSQGGQHKALVSLGFLVFILEENDAA